MASAGSFIYYDIRDVTLLPMSDTKYEEIKADIREQKISYDVSHVSESGVDQEGAYLWKFRQGLGRRTKVRTDFVAFAIMTKMIDRYGFDHSTVQLKKTLQKWTGNAEAMMSCFCEKGIRILIKKSAKAHRWKAILFLCHYV